LFEVNKISRRTKLKIGTTLVIPVQSQSVSAIVEAQRKREIADRERSKKLLEQRRNFASTSKAKYVRTEDYEPAGRAKILYTVKRGETIGHIAEWFHVRASHIRNWNNIPYGRFIYPGQRLKIWVPEERLDQYKKIAALPFDEKQKTIKAAPVKSVQNEERKDPSNWVQHKVKRGENLEKIAQQYDVAIADIKSWNKRRSSRINAGEILEIYSPGSSDEVENGYNGSGNNKTSVIQKQLSNTVIGSVTHVVKRGDTLEKIAGQYNVSIADVKKWNHLRTSKIFVGQKLKIRSEEESVEKMNGSKEKAES
jgi:LysM repeat protein